MFTKALSVIRSDLSQVNADIDKRLAIMEVHIQYLTPSFQPDIDRYLREETTLLPLVPAPIPKAMPPIWAPKPEPSLFVSPVPVEQNIPNATNVQQRYPYDIRKK